MMAGDVMLTALAAMIALYLCVLFFLIWLAKRLGWPRLAIGIGALGALYFVGTAIHTMIFCNGSPVYVPPDPAEGGSGMMVFRCAGPSGVMTYVYALVAAPCAALLLAVATFRDWTRWKETRDV